VLTAVAQHSKDTVVVVTTSLAVYGNRGGEIDENIPLPKLGQFGELTYAYTKRHDVELIEEFRRRGLNIVEARVFNHIGPGNEVGLYSGLIRDALVARSESGVYRAEVCAPYTRDVGDVRDWANASIHLAQTQQTGGFNICTGEGVSLGKFLQLVGEQLGVTVEITESNRALSQGVPLESWGNNKKLQATGWRLQYGLEQTIVDNAKTLIKSGL
jgi:GDP-4-dehydro-6-deoxy-D-mannose reductase